MKYTFTGKNMTVTDNLKQKAAQKLDRLKKLLPEDSHLTVTVDLTKQGHKVEVTSPLNKRVLRAQVTAEDVIAALDEIVDVLEKQIIKYKGRLRQKGRKDGALGAEAEAVFSAGGEADTDFEESAIKIAKTKKFALKPMDAEEAVMEMELLGHSFFVFRNGDSDEVNVVYKRGDNTYGLIEPAF